MSEIEFSMKRIFENRVMKLEILLSEIIIFIEDYEVNFIGLLIIYSYLFAFYVNLLTIFFSIFYRFM